MFQYVSLYFNSKRFNRRPCISQVSLSKNCENCFLKALKNNLIKERFEYLNQLFEGIEMPYVNNSTHAKLIAKAKWVKVVAHNENRQLENMKYWKVRETHKLRN